MNGSQKKANSKTVRYLLLATVLMFGFGYSLVPLYDVFCEINSVESNGTVPSSSVFLRFGLARLGVINARRTFTLLQMGQDIRPLLFCDSKESMV